MVDHDDIDARKGALRALRRMPVLRELPLGDVDRLASRSRIRVLGPKETLVGEGDAGDRVFLVLEGSVGVHRRVGDAGDAVVLGVRHAGEWLGEAALLQEPRSATVRAEGEARVLEVPRDVFLEAVTTRAGAVTDLLQALVSRRQESDELRIAALERKSRRLQQRNQSLQRENRSLRAVLEEGDAFDAFVGRSAGARYVREAGRRAAATDLPVLLLGETGTGKEVLARAIHAGSARRATPFVALNCGLFAETMLESELFGHARGAFTGAATAKEGLVEAAQGGTLFLDELGEMPLRVQVALLRFLELGEFRRLGETRTRSARVRVIAATAGEPEQAVEAGRLRRDLLYRLDVMRIVLPPLRERRADLPILLAHFNHDVARRLGAPPLRLREDAVEALASHDFPGNVRELENEVRRLHATLPPGSEVAREDLSPRVRAHGGTTPRPYADAVRHFKADLIRRALREAEGSQAEAARSLGLHPSNLARMMRSLGLQGERPRTGAQRSSGRTE
jgi:transcriptional regulator with PAS, ATPase and Fis domain